MAEFCLNEAANFSSADLLKGRPIKYVRKIFRKTNISNPLKRTHVRVRIRGLETLVFRKILRMYLMDDPKQDFILKFSEDFITIFFSAAIFQNTFGKLILVFESVRAELLERISQIHIFPWTQNVL